MARTVVVYNPRSSRAGLVRLEVLETLRNDGYDFAIYEVLPTNLDDNAKKLAKFLREDDLVIAAGGDGTAGIGLNGVALAEVSARLAVLPYGNFNDVARMLGTRNVEEILKGKSVRVNLIECRVDGEHFRYTIGYFTGGMMADAARVLDGGSNRKYLRKGKFKKFFSWVMAVKWFFENKRRKFLPGMSLNGVELGDMTDYMAVNSGTMAKILRVKPHLRQKKTFLSGAKNLRSFFKMAWFGTRGVFFGVKLRETEADKVEFSQPIKITIQSEGECKEVDGVSELEFLKSEKAVEVVVRA